MQDDDLVPEGALGLYGGHVAYGEIQRRQVVRNVWRDRCRNVGVERRLRTGLDFHGGADVVVGCGRDGGIPEQQGLAVFVVRIEFQVEAAIGNDGSGDLSEFIRQWAGDVGLTSQPDGFKTSPALLAAQGVQFCHLSGLSQIATENRDVDVLGEAGDQAEGLGQGSAPLEQEPRSASSQSVEQGIQGPADPEVLLDVLNRRTQARGCAEKQIESITIGSGDDIVK